MRTKKTDPDNENANLRRQVDNLPVGMLVFTGSKIFHGNRALAGMLGYSSPADLLAMENLVDLFGEFEAEALRTAGESLSDGDFPARTLPLNARKKEGGSLRVNGLISKTQWDNKPALQLLLFSGVGAMAAADSSPSQRTGTSGGESAPLAENPTPSKDVRGKGTGMAGIIDTSPGRMEGQEKMEAGKGWLYEVVAHAPLVIWALDKNGTYTLSEGGALMGMSRDPGDIIGKSVFDLYREHAQIPLDTRRALAGETFITNTTIGDRAFEAHYAPILNGEGKVDGVIGVATDITERKKAEEALLASEEKFRQLFEHANDAIFIVDPESMTFLDVNANACRRLGYDREELIGLPVSGIYPEDSLPLFEGRQEEMRKYRSTIFEDYHRRKDGTLIPVEVSSRIIHYGGIQVIQSFVRDISKRLLAEAERKASEERYRKLIEGSIEGIAIIRDYTLLYANQSLADIYGYGSPDEIIGRNTIEMFIAPHERPRLMEMHEARMRGEPVPPQYQFQGVRGDGSTIWLEGLATLVDWDGAPAAQVTYMDITQRVTTEEQLRQAQKMEAVGQLTGGVAHDFNNLLTVIQGNLELLTEETPLRSSSGNLVETALAAAEKGARLVQRLLAFSRKQPLKPAVVNLNDLTREMTDLIRRSLGETVDVETVLGAGLWKTQIDSNQFENSLLNLVLNARDALSGGGKVTIETANSRIDETYADLHLDVSPGQYVMVAVSDTGHGMPPEVADRAFEPFFTTKEVGQGSGLGLSMTYGFVKQSGGHVKIYSEPGEGTTVRMYFPRTFQAATEAEPETAPPDPSSNRGRTILVVEDDPQVRQLAERILDKLGYRCFVAEDGPTAVELIKANSHINLLFTDVVLTGSMSGVELATVCREIHPELKVLYTSGYTENAIIHHGRLDEGVDLLQKPYRLSEISAKIQGILSE